MTERIDYEITAVMNDTLLVRFSFGNKHRDALVPWDGSGNAEDHIKSYALSMLMQLRAPPPPTHAQLQQYVGRRGSAALPPPPSVFVPPVPPPLPDPGNPPPMPPMNPPPAE